MYCGEQRSIKCLRTTAIQTDKGRVRTTAPTCPDAAGSFVCAQACLVFVVRLCLSLEDGRIETGAIETGYFNFRWQAEERGTEKTEGKEDRSK